MGKQRRVVGRTLLGRPPPHKESERSGREQDFESTHGGAEVGAWPGKEMLTDMCGTYCVLKY